MVMAPIRERQWKIVSCSALGILHTNTCDILEPRSPYFDGVFVEAFRSCGLEEEYPRVIAVTPSSRSVMTPSDLIADFCNHQRFVEYARWASYRDSNKRLHRVVRFIIATDELDVENHTKEASTVVDEIADEDPSFCDWDRWERFGELFLSKLQKESIQGI